jgi:POT family proton-dependent oligopeptide transporter
VFDFFVYPFLSRHHYNFGLIRRISLGFFLGGLAMAWAAILQVYIYNNNFHDSGKGIMVSDVSIYWQFPAYFLIAISEIFASIGSLEYSYTHAVYPF